MKKRYLYLDEKKFSHLLERMEGKMTLNESQNKRILSESWIDEIIVAAKRGAGNAFDFIGKNIPTIVDNTKLLWDDIVGKALKLSMEIDDALKAGDFKQLAKNLGSDFIRNFKTTLIDMNASIVKSLGDTFEEFAKIQDDVLEFINGTKQSLNLDSLSVLKDLKRATGADFEGLIDAQRKATLKANKDFTALERILKYLDKYGDNVNIKTFYGEMGDEFKIYDISDFQEEFKLLDEIAAESEEINKLWTPFKERLTGSPKNAEEAGVILNDQLLKDPEYIQFSKEVENGMKEWIVDEYNGAIDELTEKVVNETKDYPFQVGYVNESGNPVVIGFKDKGEFDVFFKEIQNRGITPHTANRELSDWQKEMREMQKKLLEEAIKTRKAAQASTPKRKLVWVVGLIGLTITVVGIITWAKCSSMPSEWSQDFIDKVNQKRKRNGEPPLTDENRHWLETLSACYLMQAEEIVVGVKEKAMKIWDDSFKPYFEFIEQGIEDHLNKLCGRNNTEWDEVLMRYKYPCEKCIDCNAEINIDAIKINDNKIVDVYKEKIENINLRSLLSRHNVREKDIDEVIAYINDDANNGIVNGILTEDGKPIKLKDLAILICNKHNLYCLQELTEKTLKEFFDIIDFNCNELKSHFDDKINLLKKIDTDGFLGWDEEGKVDLSTLGLESKRSAFTAVSDVSGFFNQLEIFKKEAISAACEDKDDDQNIQKTVDFAVVLSNMMIALWENGSLKLDCNRHKGILSSKQKAVASAAIVRLLRDLRENDNTFGFVKVVDELDPKSQAWKDSFEEWWIKQRSLCNRTD